MPDYVLRLYITGRTTQSESAISSLRRICAQDLGAEYDLEVIDVLDCPQVAEDQKILVTPTLVVELPAPSRRLVGDLSDRERVLLALGVQNAGR